MRERFIQLLDNHTLNPLAVASTPYYGYLHDGYEHGTFRPRLHGIRVVTSVDGATPAVPASGEFFMGSEGENISADEMLKVGNMVYFRDQKNDVDASGNSKSGLPTLWSGRRITEVNADWFKVERYGETISFLTPTVMYARKLLHANGTRYGWIGCEDALKIALIAKNEDGGAAPLKVRIQFCNADNPTRVDNPPPTGLFTYTELSIADTEGAHWALEGPFPGRWVRFGFGSDEANQIASGIAVIWQR